MIITLTRGPKVWEATYSGPGSEAIASLFNGSTTIPTAYPSEKRPQDIARLFRNRNPRDEVVVATEMEEQTHECTA